MNDNSKAIAKHLHEMGVEFTAQFLQNMDKDASEAIARLTKQRDAYQVTAVEKHAELTRLRTRNEQLEAALEKRMWIDKSVGDDGEDTYLACVDCGMPKDDAKVEGHFDNCELARLLADEQPADAGEGG